MTMSNMFLKKGILVSIMMLFLILSSCSEDPLVKGGNDNNDGNKNINIKEPEKKNNATENVETNKEKPLIHTTLNGVLVDGYIKDAVVCIDKNNDGLCLGDEQTKTDKLGKFSLILQTKNYTAVTIIGTGGIDTATNKPFNGTYKVIFEIKDSNSRAIKKINITPITTLTAYIYNKEVEKSPLYNLDTAINQVATSLGIPSSKVSSDPLKNKAVFEKTQQIIQTIAILGSSIRADNTNSNTKDAFNFVMDKLSDGINKGDHQGGLDSSKMITALNKNKYNNKSISIDNSVAILVKSNMKNIKEKVATANVSDLVSVQVSTQKKH